MTTYHNRMLGDSRVSKMVEKANVFEETTKVLARKLGLKSEEVSALADVSLKSSKLGSMFSEDEEQKTCSCAQKYREFDGTCNRLQSPKDGSAFTCLTRLLPAKYADGPRDQLNSPTSCVDGSMIYGSDLHTVQSLRLFQD
ncbi:peroxidasin-like protein, partial [Limulus polyphemus]|uniref:Peroxidasin-like protein n=1 Tax=Limulus polyphemus TaxID=6850 RepID=A0ABM1RZC6_LIMPO